MNYNNNDIYKCNNIIEEKNGVISILNLDHNIVKDIIDNYYQITNPKKPLNSISSYVYKDL